MKIGIDIDDTLTNTKDIQKIYWLKYYQQNPQDGYSENIPTTINDFGDQYIEKFWDTYRQELTYKPSFKENCSQIINKLNKDGHILCIITSRPNNKYKNLLQETKKWFKKNNINISIIYTDVRDKAEFLVKNNIDLLIDDNINHCQKAINLGKKAILFNNIPKYNNLQTDNWLDLYNIINNLNN